MQAVIVSAKRRDAAAGEVQDDEEGDRNEGCDAKCFHPKRRAGVWG
jgi:hypothetical protein